MLKKKKGHRNRNTHESFLAREDTDYTYVAERRRHLPALGDDEITEPAEDKRREGRKRQKVGWIVRFKRPASALAALPPRSHREDRLLPGVRNVEQQCLRERGRERTANVASVLWRTGTMDSARCVGSEKRARRERRCGVVVIVNEQRSPSGRTW
ncbi:hypothetical protein VTG60DRAFT_387 [Thermothelomyces hinnuleus]